MNLETAMRGGETRSRWSSQKSRGEEVGRTEGLVMRVVDVPVPAKKGGRDEADIEMILDFAVCLKSMKGWDMGVVIYLVGRQRD
jgi:hypothetical protein